MNLTITLESSAIAEAITKALSRGPSLLGQNPLMSVLSDALRESEPRLQAWAREQVATVLADQEFRGELRRTLKKAMLAQAEWMGQKAARAAINEEKP